MRPDLTVELAGLRLANPVIAAAGTFGYGVEFRDAVRVRRLGAIVTKTVTPAPREGNPPPRLVPTPSGMLNAVGLQNVGFEAFVSEKLPAAARLGVPIIVSILGESADDVRMMCARLDREPAVAAIEINLSCPNLRRHASRPSPEQPELRMVAQDPEATAEILRAARPHTRKPLIAKLSPDVTDPRPVAIAAQRAGADILSLVNTFTGMSLDPATRRSRLGAMTGGLSGPAIRPLAVYRVWLVRQAVTCPMIGLGGVASGRDALEFLIAGAAAIAVGTATFAHPAAALRVLDGIVRFLERRRIATVRELIGTASEHAAAEN